MARMLKQFICGAVAALIYGSDAQSCAASSFDFTNNGVTITMSHPQIESGGISDVLDCSGAAHQSSPMQASGDEPGYRLSCTAGIVFLNSISCSLDGSPTGSGTDSGSGSGEDCNSCAEGFDTNGGCKAMETPNANVESMIPQGCESCGRAAMAYCSSKGYNIPNQNEPMDSSSTSMQTCGDVKMAYKSQGCCGNPTKAFAMGERRLVEEDLLFEELKHALQHTEMQRGPAEARNLAKSIKELLAEHTDAAP